MKNISNQIILILVTLAEILIVLLTMSLVISLNLPIYILFIEYIIIYFIFILYVDEKLLFSAENSIDNIRTKMEKIKLMEIVYNNDYEKYKQNALHTMIYKIALFIICLFLFILSCTNASFPTISIILFALMTILGSTYVLLSIKSYVKIRKSQQIIIDKELQESYQQYKVKRETYTYKRILLSLPRPQYYLSKISLILYAITYFITGCLILAFCYTHIKDITLNIVNIIIGIIICLTGILCISTSTDKILTYSTSNKEKFTILLLSSLLTTFLYTPLTNQLDKLYLKINYEDDYSSCIYNSKTNILQLTLKKVENTQSDKHDKKSIPLLLLSQGPEGKILFKNIIRAGADFQFIVTDIKNNKKIVYFSQNELKKIYNQKKSDLDMCIDLLKLDYETAKVYDDSKYIVIENREQNILPPLYRTPTERNKYLTELVNRSKRLAVFYKIARFNRGLKIRYIFNNDQFIEYRIHQNKQMSL